MLAGSFTEKNVCFTLWPQKNLSLLGPDAYRCVQVATPGEWFYLQCGNINRLVHRQASAVVE